MSFGAAKGMENRTLEGVSKFIFIICFINCYLIEK